MLVALENGNRVQAASALKGAEYFCPNCAAPMVLKQGRKVVHHFAHKPPLDCDWQSGETWAHLQAKEHLFGVLSARGLKCEAEHIIDGMSGDRRADLAVWTPKSRRLVAFELQHSPINLENLEMRANCYARSGIAQIWIPFLRKTVRENMEMSGEDRWIVKRYAPLAFEKWVHGFNGNHGMWIYDPEDRAFWHARLKKCEVWVEEVHWYEHGVHQSSGGYSKFSKKYRELHLTGPHRFQDLKISFWKRRAFSASHYNWPACQVALLVP